MLWAEGIFYFIIVNNIIGFLKSLHLHFLKRKQLVLIDIYYTYV